MSYDEHLISMAGGDGDNVDQLAAIEARAQAATEGPWETHDGDVVQSYDIAVKTGEYSYEREGIIPGEWVRENDAEFIANARTDVPALLALVREQQAKLGRVKAVAADLAERGDRIEEKFERSGNGSISSTRNAGRGIGYREAARGIRAAITATEEGK